ncbi:TauD/TfdA family dioxygenase [Pseudoalteromonas sp. CO348]|nr:MULTISPECIES: TauD/TfdA family dioxygenase [unclassified Pseudoalteromonas]MCG7542550.1 TauD/TfdA family dioxygenase [Pseudoalteromonas sp. OF7H-1]RZF97883.1 TauD/TfdA family dioxygenase [Pseudoalteromonas sp. CO348]
MLVPAHQELFNATDVECGFFSETQVLPLVIIKKNIELNLDAWFKENSEKLKVLHQRYGAILFRNFEITSAKMFESFVGASTSKPLDTYLERQLRRDRISGNVFTSTAHPKEGEIFLHNEQSFNLQFPRYIYFNCHKVADKGGATPLADTRKIYNKIPHVLRDKLIDLGYLYRRNFIPNLYVDWQWAFQAETKDEAQEYLKANQITWKWHDEGLVTLTTEQVRSVALQHPETKQPCWFNHCTSFHIDTIEPKAREFIQRSFSENEYPNHTYFGDGSSIDSELISILREVYIQEQVTFDWHQGDVLMVDNLSVCHGREPFEGERLVLTAMSELCKWEDVDLKRTIMS